MPRRVGLLSLSLLLLASPALANGRFPAANQLVTSPGNPDALILRATFGVLLSSDRGRTWDWVCERAIGYGNVWDPPIGVFASGALMAGTIDGLSFSPDHGCAWSFVGGPLTKRPAIDVVVRPDAPRGGLVLGSSNAGKSDAGAQLFTTEVFETKDDGASWALVSSAFDPTFTAQTIEVAKSDPKRIYVSGSVGERGVLYVSSDGGATFEDRTVPMEKPNERHPFVAAVDPQNADRVYVRTNGTTSRLLVTDDAGKTFRSVLSGPPLLGFAVSPDGKRVFVGSTDGLSVADAAALTFEKVASFGVLCLLATEGELFACTSDSGVPFGLGSSTDGGKTFKPVLALKDIRGPLACAPQAATTQCVADWPNTKALIDPQLTPTDGGANGGDGGPAFGLYSAGGGCSTGGGAGSALVALALAALAALGLRLRTRPFRGSR